MRLSISSAGGGDGTHPEEASGMTAFVSIGMF